MVQAHKMNTNARSTILSRIAAADLPNHPHPGDFRAHPDTSRTLQEVIASCGATCIECRDLNDFRTGLLNDIAPAGDYYSLTAGLGETPTNKLNASELLKIKVTIASGEFVVLEHGAIWFPADLRRTAAPLFTCEQLVILLQRSEVVPTMIEAMARVAMRPGWFICGPSKTADIEQCLVIGAQGARRVTVVLLG